MELGRICTQNGILEKLSVVAEQAAERTEEDLSQLMSSAAKFPLGQTGSMGVDSSEAGPIGDGRSQAMLLNSRPPGVTVASPLTLSSESDSSRTHGGVGGYTLSPASPLRAASTAIDRHSDTEGFERSALMEGLITPEKQTPNDLATVYGTDTMGGQV
ncbi:hypothetical protein SKAU_G00056480 [Synaphobranchus kaupii]|uniref:Uncharacterized protein n=1 Tax=Synaphobranchus kaupii TaxID=118154 RepID=A0A9Q1G3Y8_SYNKA|nr:hypothetical protein SKAU_G00056480 [Synaphobranchus kaupii]